MPLRSVMPPGFMGAMSMDALVAMMRSLDRGEGSVREIR